MSDFKIINQQQILGKNFKVYGTLENPLFKADDVSEWIEHSNTSMMLKPVEEDEKTLEQIGTLNNAYSAWFLTEDGLYEVLMQSRKPIARKFKKEVKKALKQIRITGGYIGIDEQMTDEQIMAKALMVAQKTISKKDELLKAKDKELIEVKVDLNVKNKFINQIAVSENSLLVREVAKIASKQGVVIGEKRLWIKLRQWGFIFKKSTEAKQEGIDRGYFEVVEGSKTNKDKTFTYHTTRVTGKGQVYIINRLLNEAM